MFESYLKYHIPLISRENNNSFLVNNYAPCSHFLTKEQQINE